MAPPRHGKPMKLYISASETKIGSMLAQDDKNGVKRVMYYLSRTLVDAETRHSPFGLVFFLHKAQVLFNSM